MGGHPGRQEQVPNFRGNLRGESCYDVVEPGSLFFHAVSSEVSFHLCKPHFSICWPEWWNLNGDCRDGSRLGRQLGG